MVGDEVVQIAHTHLAPALPPHAQPRIRRRSYFFSSGNTWMPIDVAPLEGTSGVAHTRKYSSPERNKWSTGSSSKAPVFAQAAAQRSVASIAQNRAPYGSLRAFLQHRLPAAPVAPQANQHSSKPAAPALQAHASARVLASISGADWAHPARVAGRCTTAVDQVGRSRRLGRRQRGRSWQLSSRGRRSGSVHLVLGRLSWSGSTR